MSQSLLQVLRWVVYCASQLLGRNFEAAQCFNYVDLVTKMFKLQDFFVLREKAQRKWFPTYVHGLHWSWISTIRRWSFRWLHDNDAGEREWRQEDKFRSIMWNEQYNYSNIKNECQLHNLATLVSKLRKLQQKATKLKNQYHFQQSSTYCIKPTIRHLHLLLH